MVSIIHGTISEPEALKMRLMSLMLMPSLRRIRICSRRWIKNHSGVGGQGAGDRYPLLLASRQILDDIFAFLCGNAHFLQQCVCPLREITGITADMERHGDILDSRVVIQQIIALEYGAYIFCPVSVFIYLPCVDTVI